MARRALLVLALAVGGFWLVGTFTMGYPSKFTDAERLTDTWRPAFTDAGITRATSDMRAFKAFAAEFSDKTVPALAAQLHMTPEQFQAYAAENFPDTAAGLAQLEDIVPFFDEVVAGMVAQQDNFHRADAIPTKNLPASTVPWVFALLGAVTIGAAAYGLWRAQTSGKALAVAGSVGAIAIVASLVLSVPTKAQAFEDTTDAFRSLFSPAGAQQARDYMDSVSAMATEVTQTVVPGVATALGTTPTQLVASLSQQFPAVGSALPVLPGMVDRFDGLVAGVEGSVGHFAGADTIPTKGTPATALQLQFMIPGLVLAVGGGVGLLLPVLSRRRERGPRMVPKPAT